MTSFFAGITIALLLAGTNASFLDVAKPDSITFGSSVVDIQTAWRAHCSKTELRSFTPPRIPIAKESHQQIDCQGFHYMGEPRLAEFVFADNRLQLVWILVDEDDQDRIIAAMAEKYGREGLKNEIVIGYPEHRTAWRYNPREVLFYSEDVAPIFEARFRAGQTDD